MLNDQNEKAVIRRRIKENDTSLLTQTAVGTAKVGITALTLLNADPSAAILVGLVAEFGDMMIEQREARLAEYLGALIHKVQKLPTEMRDRWQSRFDEDEGRQFFEAAWHQAAETVDPEKVEAIASLVKNSLSAEDLRLHHARWLLKIIDDLDSVELILLKSHSERNRENKEFIEQHKRIFEEAKKPEHPRQSRQRDFLSYSPQPLTEEEDALLEQQNLKYQIERERYALYTSRINHLIELGLLGNIGSGYSQRLELTPLGTALLKIIDLADDNEWGEAEQSSVVEVLRQAEDQNESLRRSISEQGKQSQKDLKRGIKDYNDGLKREFERAARRLR